MAVAYDTMCRREELVSLRVEDISEASDGSAAILIRRSKTDATGEGATAYLSPLTMRLLKEWLAKAGINEGAVFARVLGPLSVGGPLTAQVVSTVFRKVGQWIGLEARGMGTPLWSFGASGCRSRSLGSKHRPFIRDASRPLDGYQDAYEIRRARPCLTRGDGSRNQKAKDAFELATGSGNGRKSGEGGPGENDSLERPHKVRATLWQTPTQEVSAGP